MQARLAPLKLLDKYIRANRCYFCGSELTEKERNEPHGLCGDCYYLRRWVRGLRLGTKRGKR